ncbi:hypothetical protein ABG067_002469 [Albugo candida]
MVKKKSKSKRLTLHKKYKICRKVREHKRKLRKMEGKDSLAKKAKKNPGIPNNWPFKQELLMQLEQNRLMEQKLLQEQRERRKLEKKKMKASNHNDAPLLVPSPISDKIQERIDLKHSVQRADMVVIVLDARDPQGCRALSLEDGLIAKGSKKVVLVLTKIDLVPTEVAQKWITYLRRFYPTIPVRGLNEHRPAIVPKSKHLRGKNAVHDRLQALSEMRDNGNVEPLRYFLKRFGEKHKKANSCEKLHIAILGYSNVGKSTLINALKKRQLVAINAVSHAPQLAINVPFDEHSVLIDCPSMDPEYSDPSSVLMRHSIAGLTVEDPVMCVKTLLDRGTDKMDLMQSLQISNFQDHEDLLQKLAIKKGILRKGGDPDVLATARKLLHDFGTGEQSVVCLPPLKSRSRFEMPPWFHKVDLAEVRSSFFE